jgi:hypothetical protein
MPNPVTRSLMAKNIIPISATQAADRTTRCCLSKIASQYRHKIQVQATPMGMINKPLNL